MFEDSDRPCTPQDSANLKYLDCCIKETLRLYPSIPGVMRTITEDTEIGEALKANISRERKKRKKTTFLGESRMQFQMYNCYVLRTQVDTFYQPDYP